MRLAFIAALGTLAVAILPADTAPPRQVASTFQQFLSPASPQEIAAARRVDRIAWVDYREGRRNAYTAAAPGFIPTRLTNFDKDDGVDLSGIRISDDGSTVVFLRGTAPNREGWSANPSADPNGFEHAVWAARTAGGAPPTGSGAWRVVDATSPELGPDGSSLLFVKDGQIYRARVTRGPLTAMDRGERPFIREWGTQSAPKWSPDGRKIAFVSTRTDHSFIVVYDVASRTVKYMSPSVDFDATPLWLPDSRHLIFVRRPGLPFGQQSQQGGAGIGLPDGPAFRGPPERPVARGGRAQAAQAATDIRSAATAINSSPGLMNAAFKGGYSLGVWKADVTTGDAQEIWHNEPNDQLVTTLANARLAGDYLVFPLVIAGAGRGRGGRTAGEGATARGPAPPVDEWDRYYSLNITSANSRPILLTTTDGLIEDSDIRRGVGRWQDVLLLHEREGHRTATYLGRAGRGRDPHPNHVWRGR